MRPLALIALLPLAACNMSSDDGKPGIAGTGSGGERSYAARDFTAVELRGPDDVDVRVGSGFSVRAEGDSDVLDRLKIERDGDKLRVGRIKGAFQWGDSKGAKVFVTMPRLAEAAIAGAGDLHVDRVEGSGFEGSIAGSGDLAVGALVVETAKLSIAGSGTLTAAGTATALDASIKGSGDIAADRLAATRADVSIAGAGSVRAAVDGPAKVSIMGVGDVDLGPKARCTTSKTGTGEVRCGG